MLTSPGLDGHKNATARDMRAARMGEVDAYFEKWRLYLCFCTHPTAKLTKFQHFQALFDKLPNKREVIRDNIK
jgi:hypothetical protein